MVATVGVPPRVVGGCFGAYFACGGGPSVSSPTSVTEASQVPTSYALTAYEDIEEGDALFFARGLPGAAIREYNQVILLGT